MQIELIKATLKQTQTTWQRYMAACCLLLLGFVIDLLGGASFLVRHQAIELAGFKVVREAISLTYGVLFLVFVVVAWLESGILRQSLATPDAKVSATLQELPELQLWLVSPFSTFRLAGCRVLRVVFGSLFLLGFVTLTLFGTIHLLPPAFLYPKGLRTPPLFVSPCVFKAVGRFVLAVLLPYIPLGQQIRKNLRAVSKAIFQPLQRAEPTQIVSVGHSGDF